MNESIGGQPLALILGLALLGLLPFAFMALTSFVKISTVLHITRSAIGAQGVPSTTLIMALSAALSVLAMAPVGEKVVEGLAPLWEEGESSSATLVTTVLSSVRDPLRGFLHANASKKERARFLKLARLTAAKRLPNQSPPAELINETDFRVIIPAFMVTELSEAFTLGFAIFLPFLVIDLVVGNVLLALGMQMMNPTQVSLPFKLLLFVTADGWGLLAQSLVTGYQVG